MRWAGGEGKTILAAIGVCTGEDHLQSERGLLCGRAGGLRQLSQAGFQALSSVLKNRGLYRGAWLWVLQSIETEMLAEVKVLSFGASERVLMCSFVKRS